MLYNDLELQITRSDTKSQLILSTNTILTALVATFGINRTLLDSPDQLASAALAAYMLMFISILVSVGNALAASFPLLPQRKNDKGLENVFFSTHIVKHNADSYAEAFMELSLQEIKNLVLLQIHGKAQVVQYKFVRVQRSMGFLMLAIVLLAVAQVLQVIAGF